MNKLCFHHVSIAVEELKRARQFYADVLEMQELDRPDIFGHPEIWYKIGDVPWTAATPHPGCARATARHSRYWRPFRRWRRTNPTGRLINHVNKGCARPRYTTFDNISPTDYSTHKQ